MIETATEAELKAIAAAKTITPPPPTPKPPVSAATLQATHHAYLRGAIAILDHGTPTELREWSELFGAKP